MGVDAVVMCRCFQDGKTKPPPFPQSYLFINDEGDLDLLPEYDTREHQHQLDQWKYSACEHEDMTFACARIANWWGYRKFQEAREKIGNEQFSILNSVLPDSNDGPVTNSVNSKLALPELDYFCGLGVIGKKSDLIDSATENIIQPNWFSEGKEHHHTLPNGDSSVLTDVDLYVLLGDTNTAIFRSKHFTQSGIHGKPITSDKDRVFWEDVQTHNSYESPEPIGYPHFEGDSEVATTIYPTEIFIDALQPIRAEDFNFIVNPLRKMFLASVETQNPVRWC